MDLQEAAECRRVSLSQVRPREATMEPPFCRGLLARRQSVRRMWGNMRENTGDS